MKPWFLHFDYSLNWIIVYKTAWQDG